MRTVPIAETSYVFEAIPFERLTSELGTASDRRNP